MPVITYALLNILASVFFTYDKIRAKMNRGRISETMLVISALLGPFGAMTAMIVFRHKTRHLKFYVVPVFAIFHVLFFVWLWPQIRMI